VPDVLLIDDHASQLSVRERVLRIAGLSVACATSPWGGFIPPRKREAIVKDRVIQ